MVRSWCALYILTWKCASRHNGVQLFISHLASWLRTRRFSEPTFRPSGATNHWKNTVFRDFPTFSRTWIFFLRRLSLSWSSFFFSSLLWLFPSLLFICPYCRKFGFKLPSVIYMFCSMWLWYIRGYTLRLIWHVQKAPESNTVFFLNKVALTFWGRTSKMTFSRKVIVRSLELWLTTRTIDWQACDPYTLSVANSCFFMDAASQWTEKLMGHELWENVRKHLVIFPRGSVLRGKQSGKPNPESRHRGPDTSQWKRRSSKIITTSLLELHRAYKMAKDG